MYAGRVDPGRSSWRRGCLAARPGDGLANLVMAIESVKKGTTRRPSVSSPRSAPRIRAAPCANIAMAWLKAGEKDYAAARPLAHLKPAAGERAEAPALVIEAADRRDGGRQDPPPRPKYRAPCQLEPQRPDRHDACR